MNRFKKYYLVLIAVFLFSNGYAKENERTNTSEDLSKCCDPCCQKHLDPQISIYNQSNQIKNCNSCDFIDGVYFISDYLFIQPMQQGMELAMNYFALGTPVFLLTSNGNIRGLNSTWKSAFKVGIGHNSSISDWEYFLGYTRINSSINGNAKVGFASKALLGFWSLFDTGPTSNVEIRGIWGLSFDVFDLNFSRSYYNGSKLIFKTIYGLKGGIINQRMDVENKLFPGVFSEPSIFSKTKSESWLIGPRTGINTSWMFNKNFRFFLNGFVSLFYQNFNKISNSETNVSSDLTGEFLVASRYNISSINYSLEGIIGFGYESYFNRNRNHFNLGLGYEFDVYFNQNMMKYVQQFNGLGLQLSNGNYYKPGNLMFHGLNASLKFVF